jgi:hypothetical protein
MISRCWPLLPADRHRDRRRPVTVISDLLRGEYANPVRVVGRNTPRRWSRYVGNPAACSFNIFRWRWQINRRGRITLRARCAPAATGASVRAFPRLIRMVLADPAQVIAEQAGLHDMIATIHSPRCLERGPRCTAQMGRNFHVIFLPRGVRTANRLRHT